MRTSARKILSLCARIEKEISLGGDRVPRARNFSPISRSRYSALGAIMRDLNFFRRASILADRDAHARFFFAIAKFFFDRTETPQEI
jgi:hypothetical protein